MKKFIEEKHDLLVGIFAALALIAIVCEVAFGGFTKEGFVGGLKDISGILIDVLVLAVAASALIRKPSNFKEKFIEAMDSLQIKYQPLLAKDNVEKSIRYKIAGNSNALFSNQGNSFERFFELEKENPTGISFFVNKTFFDKKGGTEFDAKTIAGEIAFKLQKTYRNYDVSTFPQGANYGIKVDFKRTLSDSNDVNDIISIIDYTILLFVARNKS